MLRLVFSTLGLAGASGMRIDCGGRPVCGSVHAVLLELARVERSNLAWWTSFHRPFAFNGSALAASRVSASAIPPRAEDTTAEEGSLARAHATCLIAGPGRGGTHALGVFLKSWLRGSTVQHESFGTVFSIGWPFLAFRRPGVRMRTPPRGKTLSVEQAFIPPWVPVAPILSVHRDPLAAIGSLAVSFAAYGACRGPLAQWDAWSWRLASTVVPLPRDSAAQPPCWEWLLPSVSRSGYDPANTTHVAAREWNKGQCCRLGRAQRLNLSMHYWVRWSLLADKFAFGMLTMETVTYGQVHDLVSRYWLGSLGCRDEPAGLAHGALQRDAEPCSAAPWEFIRRPPPPHKVNVRPGIHRPTALAAGGGNATALRRKLSWRELDKADEGMARVARMLASAYGYENGGKEGGGGRGGGGGGQMKGRVSHS